MRILFIGYSNVLKRRILPYLHEIKSLTAVDIAKYYTQRDESIQHIHLQGEIFNSYDEAIGKSKADIAYISTVNSAHADWTEKALKRGMHVIVDKPAFLSFDKSLELVELAGKLNLGIAEATVYPFHPQITKVNDIIEKGKLNPKHLTINFSFPPLDPENFRYKRDLGGGALNDLGPYAMSAGRVFFNESPEKLTCLINDSDNKREVETSFSVLARYSKGRSMTGNFGFNSEYINRLNLFGDNFYFEINSVFTPKSDLENDVIMRMNNSSKLIRTEKSNCFINFLQGFIASVIGGEHSLFSSALMSDAKSMELLKKSTLPTII